MQFKVIGSGSSGNCYLLESKSGETLIIEAGMKFSDIQKALNFNLSKVVGCVYSHLHQDHSKAVKDLLKVGIVVYASLGTLNAMELADHHNTVNAGKTPFKVGSFSVMAFDVIHDVPEPVGFLIRHEEMGTMLFLTDTLYVEYRFPGLNQVVIEANFCEEIVNKKLLADKKFLRDRVIQSHMSIEICKKTLTANDLSKVQNIVLIHLSDSNSDAKRFKAEVEALTGKPTKIAEKGLVVDFDLSPF